MESLATGRWLTRPVLRFVAAAAFLPSLGLILFALLNRTGPYGTLDPWGTPIGTDFTLLWSAGRTVLEGRAADVYDWDLLGKAEAASHGLETLPLLGWHYPPLFFLLVAVLASMPLVISLITWQLTTLVAALVVIWRILPRSDTLVAAIACPVVFVCAAHGHNGFLTAALFGGGLLLLSSRPILAGILFGCLAYKPQFGIILPVALMAAGHWRTLLSGAAAVAVLTLATLTLFGPEVWTAFFASMEQTRSVVLEAGGTGWYKIQSAFSWVRMLGGSVTLAYAVQGITTAAALSATAWLWFAGAPFRLRAACLLLGSLLATPYLLDYDLVLLGPAIAFLAAHGLEHGFRRWEITAMAFAWIAPIAARALAFFAHIPGGLLAVAVLFILVAGRGAREATERPRLSRTAASWR